METTMVVNVLYDSGVEKRYSQDLKKGIDEVKTLVDNLKEACEEYFRDKKLYHGFTLTIPEIVVIDLSKVSAVSFEIY